MSNPALKDRTLTFDLTSVNVYLLIKEFMKQGGQKYPCFVLLGCEFKCFLFNKFRKVNRIKV